MSFLWLYQPEDILQRMNSIGMPDETLINSEPICQIIILNYL